MRRNGFVTFFVALGTPSSLEHNSAAAQKAERIPSNTNFGMALLLCCFVCLWLERKRRKRGFKAGLHSTPAKAVKNLPKQKGTSTELAHSR